MKRYKRKDLSLGVLSLLGAAFSLVSIAATSMLFAIISMFTTNPTSLTGAFSLFALLIAGGLSAFITARTNGDGGAIVGILSSVLSAGVILIAGLILKKGLLPLGTLINISAFLGVSFVFSALGKRRKTKRNHRRYCI